MNFINYSNFKLLVPDGKAKFYQFWIDSFARHRGSEIRSYSSVTQNEIDAYLSLLSKSKEAWQVDQAKEAIRLYLFYLLQAERSADFAPEDPLNQRGFELIKIIRSRHLSVATEKIYIGWARRFWVFWKDVAPGEFDTTHIEKFLAQIADNLKVSKATQAQAFNAILFWYKHVLNKTVTISQKSVIASTGKRLPVVLSKREIFGILEHLRRSCQWPQVQQNRILLTAESAA
jgi:hypothetical protein